MSKMLEFGVLGVYYACLLFIFCYSLLQLQLTILYRRSKKADQPVFPEPETWPTVTVQLPVYNERYVVERLLDAVAAFDYPKNKFQVQVLDDSTDETVAIIAKKVTELKEQGLKIKHICRPQRKGYKAGALQFGLMQTSDEFIAIFDADFVPGPDFLKRTIPAFSDPKTGLVQTRWGHLNAQNSVLTQLQAFGLDAHFTVEQAGRNSGNHFINFNGTGGVWRRSCIESAGGWESDTLTEDLDLSYRAQMQNWKFIYLPEIIVPAELPAAMPALKSQQYRWSKGAAETARKHGKNLWAGNLPFSTKLMGTFHLLNSTVYVCLMLASILSVPLFFLKVSPVFYKISTGLMAGFLVLLAFYWHAFSNSQTEPDLKKFLPRFLLFLSVAMGLALHNAFAVAEGFAGRKTPFVRTPKYNLTDSSGIWQDRSYRIPLISGLTLLEGIFAFLFSTMVFLAFWKNDFRLLFFHAMLAVGYGLVFYYSIRHSLEK
jgi:cellulose synthase/poly-beta-1,6-N-acetylglucosamine synthase-like glycosyltransferase